MKTLAVVKSKYLSLCVASVCSLTLILSTSCLHVPFLPNWLTPPAGVTGPLCLPTRYSAKFLTHRCSQYWLSEIKWMNKWINKQKNQNQGPDSRKGKLGFTHIASPTCLCNFLSLFQIIAGSLHHGNMKVQREFIILWWGRPFTTSVPRDSGPYREDLPRAPAKWPVGRGGGHSPSSSAKEKVRTTSSEVWRAPSWVHYSAFPIRPTRVEFLTHHLCSLGQAT